MSAEMILLREFHGQKHCLEMWVRSVPPRWQELSGDTRELTLVGLHGAIPHFFLEEEEPCQEK